MKTIGAKLPNEISLVAGVALLLLFSVPSVLYGRESNCFTSGRKDTCGSGELVLASVINDCLPLDTERYRNTVSHGISKVSKCTLQGIVKSGIPVQFSGLKVNRFIKEVSTDNQLEDGSFQLFTPLLN
ncbi:hypothetical protein QA601_17310 [Chitinispirillales bacterium ANBcel5]|uniref:hypothetical protein n=1 Tax=Cellulosispirillum alkaliphilum TaxID=3039283 RepID=UPI002A52E27D|nr:hypothetical protein [Chitinispirillales bacterium ANBcel5]